MKRLMLVLSFVCVSPLALAAEGMFTLDHLPTTELKNKYDFAPDQAWADKVMRASVRLAGGCSGSFVSKDGLVMTNHHCSNECIQQVADGTGTPRSLAEGVATSSFAVSPDGRALAFAIEKEGHRSLWRLDLAADAAPVRLTPNDSVQEAQPAISPDGRWLAYISDEAGPMQVFVRSFPDGAHKQQVSLNEGLYPFWARTGTAILYWERDALMEVPVQAGASLAVGAARRLFTAADVGMLPSEATLGPALDLAADGRFLFVRRSSDDPRRGILVVENWIEEFRKR